MIDWQPEQPGDVPQTWANVEKAQPAALVTTPKTPYSHGVVKFADWLTAKAN